MGNRIKPGLPMKRSLSTPSVKCFGLLCVAINNTLKKTLTVFFQGAFNEFMTATGFSYIFTQENTTIRPLNSGYYSTC